MSQTVPPLIDAQSMATRVRDYGLSTTNQVVTMMMSGVFATSALGIADIMRTPDEFWLRLTMWLTASVGAIATMTRQLHGNTLIVHPSPLHVPMQLTVGFLQAANFAFIPLSTGGPDGWRYAYAIQLAFLCAGYVSNTLLLNNTKTEFYGAELRDAVVHRVGVSNRLGRRIPVYAALGIVAAILAWLSKAEPWPWIHVLTGMNALMAVGALAALNVEVRAFKALLEDIERVRVAALARERGEA